MDLRVEKIVKKFGKNGLDEISFNLKQGESLCIFGPSGCGKTTLLNVVSGMLTPDQGEVIIDNKRIFQDLKEKERTALRNQSVGYMMQGNALIPDLTVLQNITCPIELMGRKIDKRRLNELLEQLNIDNIKHSYPSEISGGEYRRVLLTRVLLMDTDILLVDEPTSNLDEQSSKIVRDVLYNVFSEKKKSLIVVTHDKKFLEYQGTVIEL